MERWSHLCKWIFICLLFLSGCTSTSADSVDDFSDPASGWGAASHETYVRGYQQGEYLIQIDVPDWYVWTTAGKSFGDVEIQVNARSAGTTDNHYGVMCRYDDATFYYFAISSDGYYAIYLHESDGQLLSLTGTDMLYSPAIRQQHADNQIRAVCEGTRLSLSINGQQVAEVENDTLSKGDIGMAAGTVKTGGTSIWFDDFEVTKE